MTIPEAEQAVIRAAIDERAAQQKLSSGNWEDVADLDVARGRLREAVDALLALRSTQPKICPACNGSRVVLDFCGSCTTECKACKPVPEQGAQPEESDG